MGWDELRSQWRPGSQARAVASTMGAAGLITAATGFADHYILQGMKYLEPQVKHVFRSLPKSVFSGGYYKGGFEPKMMKQKQH